MNEIETIEPKMKVLEGNNFTKDIINVKSNQEAISYFEKEEIQLLLSNITDNRDRMLFQFLYRTGCRITEAINVTKKDLDFQNDEIVIKWLKKRKLIMRRIAMHKSLKEPLLFYTASMLSETKLFPFTRQRADQLCKKYKIGHAHKLRHTFAINFLRQSKSPIALVILKDILGHSKVETTMEYLKVVIINQKVAMSEINFD